MATGDEVTGPLNLGNPNEITIRALAETILELTGSRARIIGAAAAAGRPAPALPRHQQGAGAARLAAQGALADGLKETVAYFKHLLK